MTKSFSVLNESDLHETLKNYYCGLYNAKTEVKLDGYIHDLIANNGEIIEIQTKNLGQLSKKVGDILYKNKKIKIVFPLINSKTILIKDCENNLISKRKSPKTQCIYDVFKELTKLYDFLLDENFSLDIITVNITEHRLKTDNKIQSKNLKRRFKKDWIKTNKSLDEILQTKTFKTKDDYLKLLPDDLNEEFSLKDLKKILKTRYNYSDSKLKNLGVFLWVLRHMKLIEHVKTQGKSYIYRIIRK